MSAFIIAVLVSLALNMGKSGGSIRPVVTFTPNWGNILQGDSVTLTCDMASTVPEEPRTYHWYKDNQPIHRDQQSLEIRYSGEEDSGGYWCRISGSDISDPVTLSVTNTYVILQRPPSAIYEGDPMTLRCHHVKDFTGYPATFYKDDEEIKSEFLDEFHIHKVNLNTAGRYKCTKQITREDQKYHEHSAELFVSVEVLISPPKIKMASFWVIEGDDMAVTCDTKLDPFRAGTELQFAFYRDGQTVQQFSVSDTYRVRSTQLEDSGKYTCEVRTATDTVRKMSNELCIQIKSRSFFVTILAVAIVGGLLVIVLFAVIIWRCRNRKEPSAPSQESPQEMDTMVTDANPDPQDVCYTYLELSHLPKGRQGLQCCHPFLCTQKLDDTRSPQYKHEILLEHAHTGSTYKEPTGSTQHSKR